MTEKPVESLMSDIRLLGNVQYETVQAVRKLVQNLVPESAEAVKYGGILFSVNTHFCGVFAHKSHVSVEFSYGASIADTKGHLEGNGKRRRHLKLRSVDEIERKALAYYVSQALDAMKTER